MVSADVSLLVVDDNKDIRDLLTFILTSQGFQVTQVSEGTSALAHIVSNRPNLVLMDVMMPGLSGFEVVEQVRSHEEDTISSIPVLIITAKSQMDGSEWAMITGETDYLIKPFRPNALVEKVHQMLSLKTSSRTPRTI